VSLTAKDVAEITRLLEDSSFSELHLEFDGMKLSISRQAPSGTATLSAVLPPSATAPSATAPSATAPSATAPSATAPPVVEDSRSSDGVHVVVAPLLGTFYRAPKPGSAPFVQTGSAVEENTIVGIIEVMKLMNTVRAGAKGSVREILAIDGVLVEFGQPLLRIDKSP
jgi:acetyl-CoA carboxylase biotin carboxyl carrier protein